MSSFKSFFSKKQHKYQTQADLKDLSAEEIVRLDPSEVSSSIAETSKSGFRLQGVKQRAMFNLLSRKKLAKETHVTPEKSEIMIQNFLRREGIIPNPEVDKLIVDTTQEVIAEKLPQKDLENRLQGLKDQPQTPYTFEEDITRRLQALNTGGTKKRKRRTKSSRKKRRKTYHRKRTSRNKRS